MLCCYRSALPDNRTTLDDPTGPVLRQNGAEQTPDVRNLLADAKVRLPLDSILAIDICLGKRCLRYHLSVQGSCEDRLCIIQS